MKRAALVVLACAACGVRAPAPVDVAALLARRGPIEARRDLEIRIVADPRDVAARLGLAELDVAIGRPSEALAALEAVVGLGGPLGPRWHDADRARLAQLLVARGQARLARGASTAVADLERARRLGANISDELLARARAAAAISRLHHVDAAERAKGRSELAAIGDAANHAWRGARVDATPVEHGMFGAWLWTVGARREAYDQLAAWHTATASPRDPELQGAYLRALAWWSPTWFGAHPPPDDDLVGPERCWFPSAGCAAPEPPEATLVVAAVHGEPHAVAAARYASTRVPGAPREPALVAIADAFRRDPAIADRLGRDVVAMAVDDAPAHAALGALFDALGDPARGRAQWQAAVDASAEPAFQRGLAETVARAGDAPAALVDATAAAAAWGDPAVVWLSVARALDETGHHVDALTAARSAIDLAGPEAIAASLDVATAASRALGRTTQVEQLTTLRELVAVHVARAEGDDAGSALAAHRELASAATVARLWVVSRAHPRDLELRVALAGALAPDDPRRADIAAELVALAGDPDPDRAFAAVMALH